MSNKELHDIGLGLLYMILSLGQRVEKLEKVIGVEKEGVTEDRIKADSEKIKKKMAAYEEEHQKELDKKRDAEIERLKAEIRRLEAETGVCDNINKAMPFPTYVTRFPYCGCDPFWWG